MSKLLKKISFSFFLPIFLHATVVLTCAHRSPPDGFGSQYQKILAIYCICKEYGFKYMHTPINDINYQGLVSLEKNTLSMEFVKECNKRIFLPSDVNQDVIQNLPVIQKNLSIDELKQQKNALVKISRPYHITDKNPEIYKHAVGLYKTKIPKNSAFTIGIHVRRGDLAIFCKARNLPNAYYINLALKIAKLCKQQQINPRFELYTEVPTKKMLITKNHAGLPHYVKDTVIDPKDNKIHEFDVIPNLHKYINENAFKTFDRMINCEILIGSKSSFTACASYLKRGITVYHPFWHNLRKKDIVYNDPEFDQKILTCLKKRKK